MAFSLNVGARIISDLIWSGESVENVRDELIHNFRPRDRFMSERDLRFRENRVFLRTGLRVAVGVQSTSE